MDPIIILLILGGGVWAVYSLVTHPLAKCWRCKGAGVVHSRIWPSRYKICPRCKRKGERRGWGGRRSE